jgi:hypothetical protein
MKFSGKNFQAWPEFSLNLDGFVVMIGPSFAGKSAIFRALKGLIRNEIPEQRVRIGADQLELTLEHEGKTIKAVRKANSSTKYLTDKGEYTSLAKGIPDALKDLNAGEVQVGEYKIDPIFASQFGEQFMLEGAGPTELNTILGAFSSTEKLEYGKKQANLFVTQKNSEAKTLAEQIGDSEERCENLEQIFTKGILVDKGIKALEPKLRSLETIGFWFRELSSTKTRLVPLRRLQASLFIPDTLEAERLQDMVAYLRSTIHSQIRMLRLRDMDVQLEATINRWNNIVNLSRNAKVINETASLAGKLEALHEQAAARKLNAVVGEMESILSAAISLQASIKHTGQAAQVIRRVVDKKVELIQLETDLKELCTKNGLCDKCGKPLEHICGS